MLRFLSVSIKEFPMPYLRINLLEIYGELEVTENSESKDEFVKQFKSFFSFELFKTTFLIASVTFRV